MPVVDGNDRDVIDALGEDGVAVFEKARQVIERAGGRKRAGHGEQYDALAGKQLFGADLDRAVGGLFLEGGGRQRVADGDSHVSLLGSLSRGARTAADGMKTVLRTIDPAYSSARVVSIARSPSTTRMPQLLPFGS